MFAVAPSRVLRQYLIDLQTVTDPPLQKSWPAVAQGPMPQDVPDYVALQDYGTASDGRVLSTGDRIEHPRVRVLIRSADSGDGWKKGDEIQRVMDAIGVPMPEGAGQEVPVSVDGVDYAIRAAHVGPPMSPIGYEKDTRRSLFSFVVQLQLVETSVENYVRVYPSVAPDSSDYLLGFHGGYLYRFPLQMAIVAGSTYVFHQFSAAASWTIVHNMNKYPSVLVLDSAGDECFGLVNYVDATTLTITFSAALGGTAYLN